MIRRLLTAAAGAGLLGTPAADATAWSPWNAPEARSGALVETSPQPETNPARLAGLAGLALYRGFLARPLAARCRFDPSCSSFARAGVRRHGLINGAVLAADRISRCHAFAGLGGYPSARREDRLADPPDTAPAPFPFLTWLGL